MLRNFDAELAIRRVTDKRGVASVRRSEQYLNCYLSPLSHYHIKESWEPTWERVSRVYPHYYPAQLFFLSSMRLSRRSGKSWVEVMISDRLTIMRSYTRLIRVPWVSQRNWIGSVAQDLLTRGLSKGCRTDVLRTPPRWHAALRRADTVSNV